MEENFDQKCLSFIFQNYIKLLIRERFLIYFNKTSNFGMHCLKWFAGILLIIILSECQVYSQEKVLLTKVVIDAGHGGKDPGASGKLTKEKQITLQIALKLGNLIKSECSGVKVYYTRDKDEFIPLHERADIANRLKADLFISIHCNSNPSHSFKGAETYIMGLHRSEANLAIAKLENASILMEPDYTRVYDGFDPNSDESYITFSLYQNAFLEQSTDFATVVQDEMKCRVGLNDRGVRQAGFLVLYRTTMPSVLVETGFLSNPDEEKFLISQSGQDYIASAVFKAFKRFKAKMEGTVEPSVKEPIVSKPKEQQTPPFPVKKNSEVIKEKPVSSSPAKALVVFRVQVASSPTDIGIHAKRLEGLDHVWMYKHQGLFKYTTGELTDLSEALKLQTDVQRKGYKDAFVVAFRGEERITVAEAKKLLAGGNTQP
jgi:N-acetylmuramoyl-L-alanine amidase